jgi:hypothetical protein
MMPAIQLLTSKKKMSREFQKVFLIFNHDFSEGKEKNCKSNNIFLKQFAFFKDKTLVYASMF